MEKQIWDYLLKAGLTKEGAAGLMGNLYAESGLNPTNLQNTYNKSLGLTDLEYTKKVDNKTYKNFIKDKTGYGLAQWTFWSRKEKLYNHAQKRKKSIGDLETQLSYLIEELKSNYKSLFQFLCKTNSIEQASTQVLLKFEKPADSSLAVQQKRQKLSQNFYNKFYKEEKDMINIVKQTSTRNTSLSPNRKIEYIVLHYTAGTSSKTGMAVNNAKYFSTTANQVSADFIIDDTTIVQYNPDIKNRYCWAVGGSKYSSMSTSLGGKFYGKCVHKNCINIEMCSNKANKKSLKITDTDWSFSDGVVNNAAELVKYLMQEYNIDIDHVIMHHHVTGKICPQPWAINEAALKNWYNFLAKVQGGSQKEEEKQKEYPSAPFTVSISSVNVEYKKLAKASSTTLGKTGKGVFTIDKVSGNWGHLKSGAGWINLDNKYVIIMVTKTATKVPYLIQLSDSVKSIYIRENPQSSAKITGTITNKSKYTIIEEKNGWGKLKSGAGWIYLKNTKEVK